MRINLKQGDTRHAIKAVLKNIDDHPVDLSTAIVDFNMARRHGNLVISRRAKQTDKTGEVWVVFNEGDTDSSGLYKAEFQVTYSDGRKETFPNDGYIEIMIESRVTK